MLNLVNNTSELIIHTNYAIVWLLLPGNGENFSTVVIQGVILAAINIRVA